MQWPRSTPTESERDLLIARKKLSLNRLHVNLPKAVLPFIRLFSCCCIEAKSSTNWILFTWARNSKYFATLYWAISHKPQSWHPCILHKIIPQKVTKLYRPSFSICTHQFAQTHLRTLLHVQQRVLNHNQSAKSSHNHAVSNPWPQLTVWFDSVTGVWMDRLPGFFSLLASVPLHVCYVIEVMT